MAESQFTKRKIKLFLIILIIVAALSAAAAIGLHFYVGHNFDSTSLNEHIDDKLKLGSKFTIDDILEGEKYTYSWVKSSDINVSVLALSENEDEGYSENEGILSYSSSNGEFTVIGIAKGKILFSNAIDSTISLELPFQTKFASKDTERIITSKNNYPGLLDDDILTAEEIKYITKLQIEDTQAIDFADFIYLPSLDKLEICHASNNINSALEVKNLNLPAQTHIYVPQGNYLDYLKANSEWSSLGDRIFTITNEESLVSVILNKNGGIIPDDNGLSFENDGVAIGATLALSDKYSIEKEGYSFSGWTAMINGAFIKITDDYVFTGDLKLYAQWEPYSYTLKLYHNNGTGKVTNHVMTYDKDEAIASVTNLPLFEGCTQLGWAYESTATVADFENCEVVHNLSTENNAEISLYAVWANNVFTIEYYNGNDYFDKITGNYGASVQLTARTTPYDPTSDFVGWAYSNDAIRADYKYGETVEGIYATPNTNGIIKLYAVFEAAYYTINYSVGDATPKPSSQTNLPRGQAVVVHEAINRTGYKFKGWKDDGGIIYTPFEDYYKQDISKRIWIKDYYLNTGIVTTKSSVTLTPVWEANTFKVNFNGNGASSIYSSTTVTYGVETSFTGSVSKMGNDLVNLISNIGNVSIAGRTLSIANISKLYLALKGDISDNDFNTNSEITFTANWSLKTYSVSKANGTNGSKVSIQYSSSNTYKYGSTVSFTIKINDSDYENAKVDSVKAGGTTISTTGSYSFTMPASNVTITVSCSKKSTCIATGTLVTMADMSQRPVEELKVGDNILAWDFTTQKYVPTEIIIYTYHGDDEYKIINLQFDNGIELKIIGLHVLFDMTLKTYIQLDVDNYKDYIGDSFLCYDDSDNSYITAKLSSVVISYEKTGSYSIVSSYYYNYVTNNIMTSSPCVPGIYELISSYIDDDFTFNRDEFESDVIKYGLYDYKIFSQYMTYEQFEKLCGPYFKIAIEKGFTTLEILMAIISANADVYQ